MRVVEILTGHYFNKATKFLRTATIILSIGVIILSALYFCVLVYARILGAPPLAVPQSTLFYSDDETVIGETNIGQKRYWVPLEDISPIMIDAVVAVEDRQFYNHSGFDYKRIAGAIVADIKAMDKVQGASTITQQYARNLFLTHEKSWMRKFNEALYTIRIEMNYSKDEILEGYLNTIYFGHGMYGIQSASQYYFGKDARDLNIQEASMLAGIPKGPSIYSPIKSMENAKKRQSIVLQTMVDTGYISKKQKEKISNLPLSLNGQLTEMQSIAPYFMEEVKRVMKSQLQLDENTIAMGGLKVYTSLNLEMQKVAESTFAKNFKQHSDIQGALVAMNPKNGQVKALIGGRDFTISPFNRATQALRQPGSTIKPLLYYIALVNGFTPTTMLKSEPTTFTFDNGRAEYTPRNFNSQYANKEITLAQAIALSDNIYAVKTHLFLGEEQLQRYADKFGIESKISNLPASALGTSNVKVIEMVNAYSRIANGGKAVKPTFIKRIENHKGEVIYEAPKYTKQVLNEDQAFILTSMLTGIFNENLNSYSTVTGATIASKLTRQYAGKSGTTNTDNWMLGYTPDLVTGVWTGYDQSQQITTSIERQYAKNIWVEFMESSLQDSTFVNFKSTSKQITKLKIDPESGKISTKECPVAVDMYFIKGTEPTEYCSIHDSNPEKDNNEKNNKMPWYKRWLQFW